MKYEIDTLLEVPVRFRGLSSFSLFLRNRSEIRLLDKTGKVVVFYTCSVRMSIKILSKMVSVPLHLLSVYFCTIYANRECKLLYISPEYFFPLFT